MKREDTISFDKQIYYRLIALWVLCESVLGGIIHGFKLPFSGLLVGSSAVICVCLIAYYVPVKGAILKATIIVAIFKMMLSPQTPPTAYLAVFFQGMMGQILLYNLRYYKVSCMILGMLALVESAAQRIIVLTVLYGTSFWKAVNQFISKLTHQATINNYSMLFGGGYLLFHLIFGVLVGLFAYKLVKHSEKWKLLHKDFVIDTSINKIEHIETKNNRSKRNFKNLFAFIWIILILLFLQSYLHIGKSLMPAQLSLKILLRSLLIILTWHFLISPLVLKAIKKWLVTQQNKSADDIKKIMLLLPSTQYILTKSWQLSATKKGWQRLKEYCKIVMVNTVHS